MRLSNADEGVPVLEKALSLPLKSFLAVLVGSHITVVSVATLPGIFNNSVSLFVIVLFLGIPSALLRDAIGSFFKSRCGFDNP